MRVLLLLATLLPFAAFLAPSAQATLEDYHCQQLITHEVHAYCESESSGRFVRVALPCLIPNCRVTYLLLCDEGTQDYPPYVYVDCSKLPV